MASRPSADQHTVDYASAVAMDLVATHGRVTRAMLVEASGASTKTAGRALARLVERGRLAPGPGRGNQQDYVAVPGAEPAVEERRASQDARAERERVERLAMEIATSKGKVTRARLAERAGIEERAAGRILGAMVEDGRLVRVGFGRNVRCLPRTPAGPKGPP